MKSRITDIDLSKEFSESISFDYKTSLEFITVNPDYSLLKFREIVSCLCTEIAKYQNITFSSDKLFDQIEDLFKHQAIHKPFKDNLHEIRILCNTGVHKINLSPSPVSDNKETFETNKNKLKEIAIKARKLIVSIFEDTFLIKNKGENIPAVELVNVGEQEYKQTLFEAATSLCDRVILKAGVIYESIAENSSLNAPLIVSKNFFYHNESLYKLAANHYESSYKISADVDSVFERQKFSGKKFDEDKTILQHCELEPLYKYSVIAIEGKLGEELKEKGGKLLKVAADRGYSQALAYYGAYLYLEKKYVLAKQYLDKAVEHDEPLAYRFLSAYFAEGGACKIDKKMALEYLNKGISLGCPDSMGDLGIAYHKGIIVKQNNEEAENFLKKAIDLGSMNAHNYYTIEFNDLVGKISDFLKDFGETLKHTIEEAKPKQVKVEKKIKPNEKCPCGSGQKYKKCCRN